jgi:hypothetical protein
MGKLDKLKLTDKNNNFFTRPWWNKIVKELEKYINYNFSIKTTDNNITDPVVLGIGLFGDTVDFVDSTTVVSLSPIIIPFSGVEAFNLKSVIFSNLKSIAGSSFGNGVPGPSFYFSGITELETISTPKLKDVMGNVTIFGNPLLTSLDLSSIQTISGSLFIATMPGLTDTLNLSKLLRTKTDVNITDMDGLTSIDLASLVYTPTLIIVSSALLTSIDISSLTDIYDTLTINNNPSLTDISINPLGIKKKSTTSLTYSFNNNALSQTSVDNILAAFKNLAQTENITGKELYLDGGTSSSPTGGALNPDYVYLTVTKGWLVSIN